MLIKGLHKLSMIDYPGKASSVIFLFGCNFKCPHCQNPELLDSEQAKELKTYSTEEIFNYLEQNLGFLDGVVITGGEPTINQELPEFIKKIYEMGFEVKLDTNGTNPEMLQELLNKHIVNYIALDIKASFENYNNLAGVEVDIEKLKKAIDITKKFPAYELRVTCAPGVTKDDIIKIGEYLKEAGANKLLVLQQFRPDKCLNKELQKLKPTSQNILEEFSELAKPFFEKVEIRSEMF